MALDSKVENAIQQIFVGLLGRPAAQQGLAYWTEQVNNGFGLEEVMANIVNEQPEYLAAIEGLTRAEAVTLHFQQLFGRNPTIDAEGNNYWINGEGAEVPVDELVLALINGAQGNDNVALDNRVIVANAYTRAAAETDTFDVETGKALLTGVTHTNTSVAAALEQIDGATFNVVAAIQDLAAAQQALEDFEEAQDMTVVEIQGLVDPLDTDSPVAVFNTRGFSLDEGSTQAQRDTAYAAARADAQHELENAEAAVAALNADDEVEAYLAALADVQAAVEALAPLLVAEGAAVGAYNANPANSSLTVDLDALDITDLTAGGWDTIVTVDDGMLEVLPAVANQPGINEMVAAVNARLVADAELVAANGAVVTTGDALDAAATGGVTAVQDLNTAQQDIPALETQIADLEAAYALNAQLAGLQGAITAAEGALSLSGFEIVELTGTVVADGGAASDNDLFMFANDDAVVTGFGDAGNDSIFFGTQYTLVAIEGDDTINTPNLGNAGALEIFWHEDGGNLMLYVEELPTAGNGTSTSDLFTIELTGYTGEFSFANGLFMAA